MNINFPDKKPLVVSDKLVIGIIIVSFILFFFIMFKSCNTAPSHKSDTKELKQDKKDLAKIEAQYIWKIDSLTRSDRAKNKSIDSLNKLNLVKATIIQQKIIEIAKNKEDYEKAKVDNDIEAERRACAAAIANAEIQGQKCMEMKQQYDSTIALLNSKIEARDTTIALQQRFNSEMREKLDNAYAKYDSQNKDYLKLRIKTKWLNVESKAGSVGGFVLGLAAGIALKNNIK